MDGAYVRIALATAVLWAVCGGMVAAAGMSRSMGPGVPERHLLEEEDEGFLGSGNPWWMYIVIPLVSAVVGWATNVLALQMTFYPTEFFPACMAWSQLPEQPIGLGWQGIIPSKAPKMAEIVTTLMTEKLIDIQEMFGKLDPEVMAGVLREGMERSLTRVIEEVAMAECKGAWTAAPAHVKKEVVQVALGHSVEFISGLVKEMQINIYEVLDLIAMSRRLAKLRKDSIVTIFKECGAEEFKFIEHSGFYFGFLFGLMQALVYFFYDAMWVLPLAGFVVGFATNYLALLLIFKPVNPIKLGCFTLHGAFLKRQQEVSVKFSALLGKLFVNSENIWEEIFQGSKKETFNAMFRKYTVSFIDRTLGMSKIVLGAVIGEDGIVRVTDRVVERMLVEFPKTIPLAYEYSDETLGIRKTLERELKKLPPAEFEGVLHPAFEEDELKLIVVGGALGVAAGFIQEFLFFGNLV